MRTFNGDSLREVAFPLGGIGTGTVSLGGRGQLQDWEIFNRPGKGKSLPYTFFAIYAEEQDRPGVARVLERRIQPPYASGFGLSTGRVSGLPRMKDATFRGEYPFAGIDFEDLALPLQVRLEAYNPFIPMNAKDSGLPLAMFDWTVTNVTDKTVRVTIACSLLNAVGYSGSDQLGNRFNSQFGQNLNSWRDDDDLEGIFMTSGRYDPASPQYGSLAIATAWPDTTFQLRYERAGWWDDIQNFWDEFTLGRGSLASNAIESPSPEGQTDVGVLGLRAVLEPGQTTTLPFILSWHFPNLTNTWNSETAVKGKRLGNWYATQWADAWEVATYAAQHRERMEQETRAYHHAVFSSSLPEEVIDAASANASILRTTTVLRTEDGRMNAFEGCGDNSGCCPMNCTHVWNYVQTAALLFPELERTVRHTDFEHNTRADGDMAFRTLLPLVGDLWAHMPAADGQMGTIMKAYREWLQSGSLTFLRTIWPGIEKALDHAWATGGWDADRDGVMEGKQHNTYDIEFYGPNTMMGTFYLGALRAAEEMARALGYANKAAEYRKVYESGRELYSRLLWNGEYYRQIVNTDLWLSTREKVSSSTHPDSMLKDTEPRYQYGEGCLADQLLGQWFAHVVGLGDLLPPEQVKSALVSIFKYNFKHDLSQHESVQRVYALNDEAGLLLCTWPTGGRPQYPFPYADEVWTGIEYQVAAHCIYEGLIEEGLAIVRGVRDRHDGAKRNPWNEFECGHHYARAMSSWSLMLALSGYHYDAHRQHLEVLPKVNRDDFRCFVSLGTAWGVFSQRRDFHGYYACLEILWGQVDLRTIKLSLDRAQVTAGIDGVLIESEEVEGTISFVPAAALVAGQRLEIRH